MEIGGLQPIRFWEFEREISFGGSGVGQAKWELLAELPVNLSGIDKGRALTESAIRSVVGWVLASAVSK